MQLADARQLGLSDEWLKKLEQHDGNERQALMVVRLVGGSNAASLMQQGDILLAIDGRTVTHFDEVEHAVADAPTVKVTVWRAGAAVQLTVQTAALDGQDIDRVVQWAGATLQAPQRAIAAQRGIAPDGVYVAFFTYGSPSARYGLYPGPADCRSGRVPTPDLDAFHQGRRAGGRTGPP